MAAQAAFTEADLALLHRLFSRLGQWGSYEVDYRDGRAEVVHMKITIKSIPRWLRLLAAASPEALTGRPH